MNLKRLGSVLVFEENIRMRMVAVFLIIGWSAVEAASPLMRQDFEKDTSGWVTMGGSGNVQTTHEPANVKAGKGALEFGYTAAPKSFSAALLPLPDGAFANLKTLRFWLKTDSATAVGVMLSEKAPGGNYTALVWSPKETWQLIELTPTDFALNEGPTDPKDEDGKLDLDRLQAVGIVDVSQIFSAAKSNPDFPIAVDPHTGKHSLYIDDFEALDTAQPSPPTDRNAVVIDGFSHHHVDWMTLGGADLRLETSGKPVTGHAMKAVYGQNEGKYVIFIHQLGGLDLRGKNRLAFDIASEKPSQLLIAVEERLPGKGQGPRYNVDVEVNGGGKSEHREIAFGAFQADENGVADANGKLDLDKIKTISILDISSAFTKESGTNTIWIGNIQAVSVP